MSSPRLYRDHKARKRVEYLLQQLDIELRLDTPRRLILPLLELCDLHLDQAVSSQATAALRRKVEAVRARVNAPPHLAVVH